MTVWEEDYMALRQGDRTEVEEQAVGIPELPEQSVLYGALADHSRITLIGILTPEQGDYLQQK
jgi:hypothetical protein